MENKLTKLEEKLQDKAEAVISKYLNELNGMMKSQKGREIFDSVITALHIKHVKSNDGIPPVTTYEAVKIRDIFSNNHIQAAIKKDCIKRITAKEVKIFLEKVENPDKPIQPNSSSQRAIVRAAVKSHIDKCEKQLEEKKQMKKYLEQFLRDYVYKGSDAKQKIEKELIALSREINALQILSIDEDELLF